MKAKNNAIEKLLPELNDDAIAWLDRYEAIAERAKGNGTLRPCAVGRNEQLIIYPSQRMAVNRIRDPIANRLWKERNGRGA